MWAASDECDMPISFHSTGYPLRNPSDEQMAKEYYLPHRLTFLTVFQIAGAEFLSSIIFSGATERHPGFKFVLGECGASWVPYVLGRMDDEYEDYAEHGNFSIKPSEYWERQGYTTFQKETTLADVVHLVGEDNIIWGSDYPHPDCIWPDSRTTLEEDLGSLEEETRRKITCENAGRLYHLIK